MYGYKLEKPKTVPRIVWACKTKVDQYHWQNGNQANMIEFGICRSSKRTFQIGDHPPITLEGDTLSCILGNESCRGYAEDSVPVEIISVAIALDGLTYTGKELDIEDLVDPNVIILPAFQSDLTKQTLAQLEHFFYQIIEISGEHGAASEVLCASMVLRMMSEIDRIARQTVRNKRGKYIHYYVDKAESILLRRYHEKLTAQSIANELSISPNYLSAIFKASIGVRLVDRLLEIRMKKAAALLDEGRLTESEIAASVGYEDLSHFRRRFKHFFGVSIRDYSCINKELTLYHDKPQRQSK